MKITWNNVTFHTLWSNAQWISTIINYIVNNQYKWQIYVNGRAQLYQNLHLWQSSSCWSDPLFPVTWMAFIVIDYLASHPSSSSSCQRDLSKRQMGLPAWLPQLSLCRGTAWIGPLQCFNPSANSQAISCMFPYCLLRLISHFTWPYFFVL